MHTANLMAAIIYHLLVLKAARKFNIAKRMHRKATLTSYVSVVNLAIASVSHILALETARTLNIVKSTPQVVTLTFQPDDANLMAANIHHPLELKVARKLNIARNMHRKATRMLRAHFARSTAVIAIQILALRAVRKPNIAKKHAPENYVDVIHPLCQFDGCDFRPIFGIRGSKKAQYCKKHAPEGYINLLNPRCKTPLCNTTIKNKYDGYCRYCFGILFPNSPAVRNYKTKERAVDDFLQAAFPNQTLILDKYVADGCSRRRPDILIDMGTYVVMVEIDENQHIEYAPQCEEARLNELWMDVGYRPLVLIRFNPDEYFDAHGKKIPSCWTTNAHIGLAIIKKTKQKEWQERLACLRDRVQHWIDNVPKEQFQLERLFYDEANPEENLEDEIAAEDDVATAAEEAGESNHCKIPEEAEAEEKSDEETEDVTEDEEDVESVTEELASPDEVCLSASSSTISTEPSSTLSESIHV